MTPEDQRVPARRPGRRGQGRRHPRLRHLPAGAGATPSPAARPTCRRRRSAATSDSFTEARPGGWWPTRAGRATAEPTTVEPGGRPGRVRRPGPRRPRVGRHRPRGLRRRAQGPPGPRTAARARSTPPSSEPSTRPAGSATPTSAPSTSCSPSPPDPRASWPAARSATWASSTSRPCAASATALSAYSYARESITFAGISAPIRAALEDIRAAAGARGGGAQSSRLSSSLLSRSPS